MRVEVDNGKSEEFDYDLFTIGAGSDSGVRTSRFATNFCAKAHRYWKGLWQRLNLLRLYCQHCPENREVFSSIRGYKYLLQVVDGWFHSFFHHHPSLCDYAKEVFREVGRIVDPISLKDNNFPRDFLFWIATILCCHPHSSTFIMACIFGMQIKSFYNMDHHLYLSLVLNLSIEPDLAKEALVFWLFLEEAGYPNVVKKIADSSDLVLKSRWEEVIPLERMLMPLDEQHTPRSENSSPRPFPCGILTRH
jgi:hypothetical protein